MFKNNFNNFTNNLLIIKYLYKYITILNVGVNKICVHFFFSKRYVYF